MYFRVGNANEANINSATWEYEIFVRKWSFTLAKFDRN